MRRVPGAFIPGGAEGLPADFTPDPISFDLAVNTCTGILGPPAFRSSEQAERLATILRVTTIPENFLLTDMGFATFGLSDLVHDKRKLNGKIGAGNEDVIYSDPVIDAGIQRVEPNNGANGRLRRNFTPAGEVGAVKIVSLHTDKDGLVIVENETEYANVVPAANLTTAIVVEGTPSHCGFTPGELVAGWESLRGWVAGGSQPSAASIQETCQLLEFLGVAQGPCRIDSTFVLGSFDERVPPR